MHDCNIHKLLMFLQSQGGSLQFIYLVSLDANLSLSLRVYHVIFDRCDPECIFCLLHDLLEDLMLCFHKATVSA